MKQIGKLLHNTIGAPKPAAPGGALYDTLISQLSKGTYQIVWAQKLEHADVLRMMERARAEHPEFFWLNAASRTTYQTASTTLKLEPFQGVPESGLIRLMQEQERAAGKILSQMPQGRSDYEKALFMHDHLIGHCRYDSASKGRDDHHYCHTAYGCIVQGKAVCAGYAAAYQYLLQKCGIPCGVVSGIAKGSHAWNYVQLAGDYYWVDVTWDDPVFDDPGEETLRHIYFLLDDKRMLAHRSLDQDNYYVPKCTTMKLNFFVQNGLYFEKYDRDPVLRAIASQPVGTPEKKTELMFGSKKAMQAAKKDLVDSNALRTLPAYATAPYSYSENENMFVLGFAARV